MRIGLIDVDSHRFPNIPLMKLSAWHKSRGDSVEWYQPLFHSVGEPFDRVYCSKVFSFTQDFQYYINSKEVIKRGSGYAIRLVDGKEIYDCSADQNLPDEIEHIYPDYSIYPSFTEDKAFGFLSRGCPRQCPFCHVSRKEKPYSYKVADLSEFWKGQNNIVLCDPNILACPDHMDLLQQLVDSKATVEITQGIDVRMVTEKNVELLKRIDMNKIHIAYDTPADRKMIEPKIKMVVEQTGLNRHKGLMCFILVNFKSTIEEDLHRIQFCREMNISPFPMIYDKEHCDPIYKRMQRWCNNFIFWKVKRFEYYGG